MPRRMITYRFHGRSLQENWNKDQRRVSQEYSMVFRDAKYQSTSHASAAATNFTYRASHGSGMGNSALSCCVLCAATRAPSMIERPQLSPPARMLDSMAVR